MRFLSVIMLMFALLMGCEKSEPTDESMMIYESRNVLQCEPGSGLSPAASAAKLSDTNVRVFNTYCGYKTGVMFPAACGMGTPDILIHTISESDLRAAEQMGFSPIDALIINDQDMGYEIVDCDET